MQVNQSLLTLVPLSLGMQPLDKPSVSPSFHPARGHSHNTPNPQAAIHPTMAGRRGGEKKNQNKKKNVLGLPKQPEAQNAGSDYIQGSAECCWSQFASSSVMPCPSNRTQTCKQTELHYAVFVCVRACRLQAADSQTPSQPRPPALVPSQISQPPLPPPSSLRGSSNSVARRLPARRQRSSPELLFFFFFCHGGQGRSCEGLPWCSVGYLFPSVEHRDGIVPVRPPSASNWFQPVPVSRHKALALQHGLRDTHRQQSRPHLLPDITARVFFFTT